MGTDPMNGTTAGPVMRGLARYVNQRGYGVQSVTYQGWRPLPKYAKDTRMSETVNLAWLRSAIAAPNAIVLLNVGWYSKAGEGTF